MRKSILSSIIDAMLNRIASCFSNIVLRRLSTQAAAAEALDVAAVEQRIQELRDEDRLVAAEQLATFLEQCKADDPSYDVAMSFGRQLLADDYAVDTQQLPGDPQSESQPDGQPRKPTRRKRGRPRGAQSPK